VSLAVGDGTIVTVIGEGDDFFSLCYHANSSSSIGRRMVRGSATDICHTGKRRHLPLASEATVAFLSFQFTALSWKKLCCLREFAGHS
jgi:hypothetical protein